MMKIDGRAGHYTKYGSIKCFDPKPLPPEPSLQIGESLLKALSLADRALARLDGATTTLPDPDLFVYAFMRQEAVLSSQIEGTEASLDDLLEFEANKKLSDIPDDVTEVVNYLSAMRWALDEIHSMPLSLRLIRGLHKKLLASGRGADKAPGEFRENQNWIGPPGCSLEDATFVPPAVPLMQEALSNWEKYLHAQPAASPLIKCALAHAQFETIHPFSDGNGRVGRMIVTLMLCSERILAKPVLYLSLFFRQNRQEYYNRLQAIRDEGDWENWVLFFLRGVSGTSKIALKNALKINALRERMLAEIPKKVKSSQGAILVNALFKAPYVNTNDVVKNLEVSFPTASKLLRQLEDLNYLINVGGASRNRVFAFKPYLDILHENVDDLTEVIEGEDLLVTTQ